jgi:hypothetical protein
MADRDRLGDVDAIRRALFLVNRFIVIRRHRSGDRLDTDCVARLVTPDIAIIVGQQLAGEQFTFIDKTAEHEITYARG